MDTKICHVCGIEKPLSDFYRMPGMRDGHRNDCKVCNLRLGSRHLDHDHTTGKIRGFLCIDCNHGIGKLKDDPDLLMRAVVYLREGGFLELLTA